MPRMERFPEKTELAKRKIFATNIYDTVDFLFQRRRIASVTGGNLDNRYCELTLTDREVDFIAPAFAERFIDPPHFVEISLVGANPNVYESVASGGVMIKTEHVDGEDIYTSLYSVAFEGRGDENIQVIKDTIRSVPPDPDAFYFPRYDGASSSQWTQTATGSNGAIWIPGVDVGSTTVDAGAGQRTYPIFDGGITFANVILD